VFVCWAHAEGYAALFHPIKSRDPQLLRIPLFGERIRPEVRAMPDEAALELEAFIVRRRQLINMQTAEKNRLSRVQSPVLKKSIETHIRWLDKELKGVDDEIDKRIKENPLWRAKEQLLISVPGVGPVTSRTL